MSRSFRHSRFIITFLIAAFSFSSAFGESRSSFNTGFAVKGMLYDHYISASVLDPAMNINVNAGMDVYNGFFIETGAGYEYLYMNKGVHAGSVCILPGSTCNVGTRMHKLFLPLYAGWSGNDYNSRLKPVIKAGVRLHFLFRQKEIIEIIEQFGMNHDEEFTQTNNAMHYHLTEIKLAVGMKRRMNSNWSGNILLKGGYVLFTEEQSRPHELHKLSFGLEVGASYYW